MIDMYKWLDIGHSYTQHSSSEVARKMNFITKTKFGSDTKMKKFIMERCSFKSSSKKEDTTAKGCVARLITQKNGYLVC